MLNFLRRYFRFLLPLPLYGRLFAGLLLDRRIVHEILGRRRFFSKAFHALKFNGIRGDYLEFGCHGGTTFKLAYDASRREGLNVKLWGFDSFAGLPATDEERDEHPFWLPGALATSVEEFHTICRRNRIPREAYQLVQGYYDDSLTRLSASDEPVDICLAYIDCDLYSSTRTVLDFLRPRLKHGMIIAFDDYFCWSETQASGERRAMLEAFSNDRRWHLLPYVQFGWHGMSFVVEERRCLEP